MRHQHVLLGDPSLNYATIGSWDLENVLFKRQRTALPGQVLYQPGSDGLLNSENPHFVFGLFLPVPPDHGPHQLPGPLGISQGLLKVLGRWLGFCPLWLGRSTIKSNLSRQSLTFSRDLFFLFLKFVFGEAPWGFTD